MATLAVGQIAPAFKLQSIAGETLELNEGGARLTLAAFFKTTCPTCMMTWRYLEKMYQTYGTAGLAVWGISQHKKAPSAEFASEYGSTFPILIDEDWTVSRQYDPEFVPTLFLITPDGKIIEQVVSFNKAALNQMSETIAARLETAPVMIAPDNDDNPAFKPG